MSVVIQVVMIERRGWTGGWQVSVGSGCMVENGLGVQLHYSVAVTQCVTVYTIQVIAAPAAPN